MRKLEDELKIYTASDVYPFHMPGHKRRGNAACSLDITEVDGFDNLHAPEGLLLEEMKFAAAFYHSRETFFSVNGSTCGLLAAISAAVPRGGRLLIERGAHISVYHAAYLRGLELEYMDDGGTTDMGSVGRSEHVSGGAACRGSIGRFEPVGRGAAAPDAIVLTSPSYEGCVKDVAGWAKYARRLGIPLIVDEAHGAHFSMHPYFPESAVRLGADVVIQSTHKTLPAMTQTALIHNVTGRVDGAEIQRFLDIYETSSPSYVLLASLTSSIHLCAENGAALFERYASRLKALRAELAGLKSLQLVGGADACLSGNAEFPPYPSGTRLDPGKLVISGGGDLTGIELYDRLLHRYHLQPEMKTPDSVLLMTSVMDTDEGFARLVQALLGIDSGLCGGAAAVGREDVPCGGAAAAGREDVPCGGAVAVGREDVPCGGAAAAGCDFHAAQLPPVKMRLADACDVKSEAVRLSEAPGRVAADYVIVYPPDSPLVVPGEVFTEDIVRQIRTLVEQGLAVTGLREGCVRCVADGCVADGCAVGGYAADGCVADGRLASGCTADGRAADEVYRR